VATEGIVHNRNVGIADVTRQTNGEWSWIVYTDMENGFEPSRIEAMKKVNEIIKLTDRQPIK